jgi:hypothetical protein
MPPAATSVWRPRASSTKVTWWSRGAGRPAPALHAVSSLVGWSAAARGVDARAHAARAPAASAPAASTGRRGRGVPRKRVHERRMTAEAAGGGARGRGRGRRTRHYPAAAAVWCPTGTRRVSVSAGAPRPDHDGRARHLMRRASSPQELREETSHLRAHGVERAEGAVVHGREQHHRPSRRATLRRRCGGGTAAYEAPCGLCVRGVDLPPRQDCGRERPRGHRVVARDLLVDGCPHDPGAPRVPRLTPRIGSPPSVR